MMGVEDEAGTEAGHLCVRGSGEEGVGWGSGWEDGTMRSALSPLTFGGAAFLSGYDALVKKPLNHLISH